MCAETFHWILVNEFTKDKLPVSIVHYFDDILLIIPAESKLEAYSERFSLLCEYGGLVIKEFKNEQGWLASFGGVEIDTEKMVIHLPQKKLAKGRSIIETAIKATSLSLLDLQKITGYLLQSTPGALGGNGGRHIYLRLFVMYLLIDRALQFGRPYLQWIWSPTFHYCCPFGP